MAGAVSDTVTTEPAGLIGTDVYCVQYVSPEPVLTHWSRLTQPGGGSVRPMALSR